MPAGWPEKYCLECGTKLFLFIKRDISRKNFVLASSKLQLKQPNKEVLNVTTCWI